MILMTAVGPMLASQLEMLKTEREIPAGKEVATEYFYRGELVKRDVDVQISADAMVASGLASL